MNRFTPKVTHEIREAVAERVASLSGRLHKAREAAGFLFFTYGIYPSAAVVRDCIGVGSVTDVNEDLRGFWEDLRNRGAVKIEAPMLPDPVTDMFGEALAKVWELALDKAHGAMDGERQEAAEQVAQAQRETFEAERMRMIADDRATASERELRQEREARVSAEKRIEASAAEIEGLRTALANSQDQAEAEFKARQEAEERFSRELETERAARKHDAEMLDGEIKFAKMQIEAARAAEKELRDQLRVERVNKEAELVSYRQRANGAEEALGAARMELAEIKGRSEGLNEQLAELRERIKVLARTGVRGAMKPAKRRSLRR